MTANETFTIEKLAARLDLVERWNRALRIIVVMGLVIAGAALTIRHFDQPNLVAAKGFVVQNNEGKAIAVLGADANGMPSLLLSGDGKVRAVVGLKNDGSPYLAMSDADGKVRWAVAVDSSGAHVSASDAAGKELPAR
jgi:hypothetical protein